MSTDIETTLLDFVRTELVDEAEASHIEPETDLLSSGLVASLGVMRLVQFIEQRFGITVPPEDLVIENFIDIATLGGYLERRGVGSPSGDGDRE